MVSSTGYTVATGFGARPAQADRNIREANAPALTDFNFMGSSGKCNREKSVEN
jgi:hypothetical protein